MKGKNKNKKIETKIKVDHNFNEVTEGIDYIMTIKDQNVLDGNENDIDILENEILNVNKKMKLSEKLILDNEQDKYLKDQILSKYDENKQEGFIIKNSDNSRKGITKADEPILDLNENEGNKNENEIDYENQNEENKKNEINSIKEKLKELKAKNNNTVNKIELMVDKKFESDYLKPEEFKPKEIKKKKFTKKIQLKSFEDTVNDNDNEIGNNITKENNNNNNNNYREVNDFNELESFLERQRNLINKEKLKNSEEEKLKFVNITNKVNEEKDKEKEKEGNLKNKGKNIIYLIIDIQNFLHLKNFFLIKI